MLINPIQLFGLPVISFQALAPLILVYLLLTTLVKLNAHSWWTHSRTDTTYYSVCLQIQVMSQSVFIQKGTDRLTQFPSLGITFLQTSPTPRPNIVNRERTKQSTFLTVRDQVRRGGCAVGWDGGGRTSSWFLSNSARSPSRSQQPTYQHTPSQVIIHLNCHTQRRQLSNWYN